MKAKKNLDLYSDKYEKEIHRENAYITFVILGIIRDMMNLSDELSQALYSAMDIADTEIGTEDIIISKNYD